MDLLERQRREDQIQAEFNNYKRAGSTLLQAGRIDEKKYYANVRNKGIQLGLLTENDYPTDLPAAVEPLFRITGATLGAIAGGVAGIAGRQNPLTSASVGAGLGGAGATAIVREMAELLNPDLPLAPIGKKISDAGMAGAIDFGGTMIVGGAFNQVGKLIGDGAKLSARGAANLANKTPEQLRKISDGIPKKIGFLQRMATDKTKELNGLVEKTVKEMEEQGLTPYMAAMSPEIIKSYFQAAGVMPILGTPVQKLYKKQVDELVTRLVDGVKKDVGRSAAEGKAPLLSPGSFKAVDGKIIRNPSNIPDELNNTQLGTTFIHAVERNINKIVDEKKLAYRAFDNSINKLPTISTTTTGLRGTVDGTETTIAQGKSLEQIFGIKNGKTTNNGIFVGNRELNESANAIADMQRRYIKPNSKEYVLRNVKFNKDGTITGKNLNQLYSNVRDAKGSLQRNLKVPGQRSLPGDAVALARLGNAQAAIEASLKTAGRAGDDVFNQLSTAKNLQKQLDADIQANIPAIRVMGSENMYKVLASEAPEFAVKGTNLVSKAQGNVTLGTVVKEYFDSPSISSQQYLKKILDEQSGTGLSSYKALVTQEMDDVFYKTIFEKANRTGDFASSVPDFRKAMGIDGRGGGLMKSRLTVAYGKETANKMISELPKVAKVMEEHMIKQPNMSNFVVRNAILSGSIGIGSIGILGYSMGGVLGTAVSLGIMRSVTNFLAQPYSKQLLSTAISKSGTPAGDVAATRIMDELNAGTKSSQAFNNAKIKTLAKVNPDAFRKLTTAFARAGVEIPRQAGIEATAQATGLIDRPDEDILRAR